MANRYLVKSGVWSDPSVWSATSGGAGGAGVPTESDTALISKNFTVTLDGDAIAKYLNMSGGRINISSFSLFAIQGVQIASSAGGTLDMGSGKIEVGDPQSTAPQGKFIPYPNGSLTIISGTSKLVINASSIASGFGQSIFNTLSSTYNDVEINLYGTQPSYSYPITGSPTFRSLTIQSKNSEAHTVNLSDSGFQTLTTSKLVLIGSSVSNRLLVKTNYSTSGINIPASGTSYGQFVDMRANIYSPVGQYIGSNSVKSALDDTKWLLQDPPKASTLIDEFSSLSSSRWETQAVGSGYVNVSGGKLNMGWAGGSAYTRITSKDTYDLVDETIYMKVTSSTGGLFMGVTPVAAQGDPSIRLGTQILASGERYWRITSSTSGDNATLTMAWFSGGTWVQTYSKVVPSVQLRSVRFQIDGTKAGNVSDLVVDSVGVGPFPTQPEADFSATPTSGKRPVTVQFTDLTKGIPDTWSWNFGDGYTSTQQNPSHPYSKAGTYTVSLTASNSVGTDTVTKTALITIQPEVFSRTAGGTFLLGGDTNRRLIASRTAGGTFLLGGTTRAVLIRDAEAIQDKTYLYKVYDPDGNFIEVWKDVADEPQFTHEINSIGSSMTVELARNSDTVGTTTSPILDDDGQAILDDAELPILGSMETRNQIGAGTSVDYNNRVDIVAFYGSSDPLHDDEMDEILDDNGEAIITEVGAPNGRRIFTGFISEINSRYGNTESTVVQLTSYGFDLDQYPITTSDGKTTVPFLSKDPSQIARDAVDKFVSDSIVLGTTNHSTNPSFETGSGTVEVRRNTLNNPSFRDSNTTGWGVDGRMTSAFYSTTTFAPSGRYVRFTTTGLPSNTTFAYCASNATLPLVMGTLTGYVQHNNSTPLDFCLRMDGTSSSTVSVPPDTWTKLSFTRPVSSDGNISIRSISTIPNGTYVYLSSFMFETHGAELPYFDGEVNDGFDTASLTPAWTGTANNSESVLNGVGVSSSAASYDGAGNTPTWLSKDNPHHGQSFVRSLVIRPVTTRFQVYPIDTSGTSNEQLSALIAIRTSRPMQSIMRWRQHTPAAVVDTGDTINTGNTWVVAKSTGSPPYVNATYHPSFESSQVQPGDIIDIDNHMVVKGNYTGSYFDGNSQNAAWTGSPNASTSALLKSQTYTKRTSDSIATTGTQVSYTFRNNTYKEVLDKVLELMPSNWYYRVGLGDNTVYFRERSNTPQHLFYLGKHIKSLDLKGSIMDVTNHVLFTGGGDPALYIEEKQAPAARTRRGLEIVSDSRVTLDTSARIIAQGKIDAGNKMQNRSTIEILAKQYNIEEIQVGHVVGFRNFGNEIDNLQLIVVGVNYSPDIVQLSLERLPPTVPKRLADITRNLSVQENNNTPAAPS